jgi:hypothetical protein
MLLMWQPLWLPPLRQCLQKIGHGGPAQRNLASNELPPKQDSEVNEQPSNNNLCSWLKVRLSQNEFINHRFSKLATKIL